MNERFEALGEVDWSGEEENQSLTAMYVGEGQIQEEKIVMKRAPTPQGSPIPADVLKEAFYLKYLSSSFTSELRDIIQTPTHIYFVLSYHGPSLSDILMSSPDVLTPPFDLTVVRSLLETLDYFHMRNIAHLALSPDCVLIEKGGKVRVEGFGHAQMGLGIGKSRSNDSYFNEYSAPEVLNVSTALGPQSDMWSFALLLVSILMRRPLPPITQRAQLQDFILEFFPNGATQCAEEILREKVPSLSPLALDLLRHLLLLSPNHRLSSHEALHHAFFRCVSLPSEVED